jgi:hypothetical protein
MNVLALQAESIPEQARVLKKILTKLLKKAAPNSRYACTMQELWDALGVATARTATSRGPSHLAIWLVFGPRVLIFSRR